MTVLNFKQEFMAPSTNGGVSRAENLLNTPVSTVVPQKKSASFSLDEFVESLTKANPEFGRIFAEQGLILAPLATTDNGEVTLTSLRMSSGLTQAQLAQKVGQKQSNISLMESGQRVNIYRDSMKKLCEALGTDMKTLDDALDNSKMMFDKYIESQERRLHKNLDEGAAA